MAQEQFVQKRKGRCMAQILDEFERELEPLLPRGKVEGFKALVRRKLNGFASDVIELMKLEERGERQNAAAVAVTDRLYADGRHNRGER